jgi:hypothetical protein
LTEPNNKEVAVDDEVEPNKVDFMVEEVEDEEVDTTEDENALVEPAGSSSKLRRKQRQNRSADEHRHNTYKTGVDSEAAKQARLKKHKHRTQSRREIQMMEKRHKEHQEMLQKQQQDQQDQQQSHNNHSNSVSSGNEWESDHDAMELIDIMAQEMEGDYNEGTALLDESVESCDL